MTEQSADATPGEHRLLWPTAATIAAFGSWMLFDALPGINWVLWTGAAAAGVAADGDPDPSALLANLPTYGWASNWAGAYPNAPEAYYAWMYYDGWGGKNTSNLDCTGPSASGCWGHRDDVLSFSEPGTISMGASVSRDPRGQLGYAMTIVWTPASNWTTYSFSWTPAQVASASTSS